MDDAKTAASPSYSAEHRRRIRQGLSILAKVAIRAHLQQGSRPQATQVPETMKEDSA